MLAQCAWTVHLPQGGSQQAAVIEPASLVSQAAADCSAECPHGSSWPWIDPGRACTALAAWRLYPAGQKRLKISPERWHGETLPTLAIRRNPA